MFSLFSGIMALSDVILSSLSSFYTVVLHPKRMKKNTVRTQFAGFLTRDTHLMALISMPMAVNDDRHN
jgi:hypothetical protein